MISLSHSQRNEIFEHAKGSPSLEICGILAGKNGRVEKVYKMTNTSETPELCYFMDSKEQFKIIKEIRGLGLELVGIYHSHPESQAYPSGKDVELAFYPEAAYIIISLQGGEPVIRAFRIVEGEIKEETIDG